MIRKTAFFKDPTEDLQISEICRLSGPCRVLSANTDPGTDEVEEGEVIFHHNTSTNVYRLYTKIKNTLRYVALT